MLKSRLVVAAVTVMLGTSYLAPQSGVANWHEDLPSFTGLMRHFIVRRELRPAPDFQFSGPAGVQITLSDFRGKVVLLNFWATWCPPCVKEMPSLDALQERLGSDRFEVVALSLDREGLGVVEKFFTEHKLKNLRVYIDTSNKAMETFRVGGLPTTLLIDPKGQIVGTLAGPAEWDSAEAEKLVEYVVERTVALAH